MTQQKREELINELSKQSTSLQNFIDAKYPGFAYEAGDVVNESALKVYEMKPKTIDGIKNVKSFAKSVLYNTLFETLRQAGNKGITRNDIRKEEYKQYIQDDSAGHLKRLIFDNINIVTAALNNKKLLSTFQAYFIDGLKMSDIAKQENVNPNTISMRLRRIRTLIKNNKEIKNMVTLSNIAGRRYVRLAPVKCLSASEIEAARAEHRKSRNPFIGQRRKDRDAAKMYRAAKRRLAASYPRVDTSKPSKPSKPAAKKAYAFDAIWRKMQQRRRLAG